MITSYTLIISIFSFSLSDHFLLSLSTSVIYFKPFEVLVAIIVELQNHSKINKSLTRLDIIYSIIKSTVFFLYFQLPCLIGNR